MNSLTICCNQSKSYLNHAALTVVLEYWMIPNLGWSIDKYTAKLPIIRETIIADRLRYESSLDRSQSEHIQKELLQHYEREFLYFDTIHAQMLKDAREQEKLETYLRNLVVS
jgi:hypothetical protein